MGRCAPAVPRFTTCWRKSSPGSGWRDGFSKLVEGTPLTVDDILKKVMDKDWYLTAQEARELGLIAGVV